jgi:hypothetical protein
MDEEKEIYKTDANEVVSPKNTEKLYGSKADHSDPPAGSGETIEETLPEDFSGVDQEVGQNIFPSQSAREAQELGDKE